MTPQDFTQLGFGLSALLIIFVVVKYFIAAITRKDEQIIKLVADFNTTISNHLTTETRAFNGLSKMVHLQTKMLQEAASTLVADKRAAKKVAKRMAK
jgi:hypothetical protein